MLLLHGSDHLHHSLHQLSLYFVNLTECLSVVQFLVQVLLVEVIAGLLTCVAVGVHHLMVVKVYQRTRMGKEKNDTLLY
jgi:uncharacterized membrane protein